MRKTRNRLELIPGGLRCETRCGPLRIVAAPQRSRPFDVGALVVEEDTWLIMSAEPVLAEPAEHPIRLMTDLIHATKQKTGSIVVKQGTPLKFLAIVHDVDRDPTWKEGWVKDALAAAFEESEKRGLDALGLPPVGTRHGRLSLKRFAHLLTRALQETELTSLKRLWLITPHGTQRQVIELLEANL